MEVHRCAWIAMVLLAVTIPACATGGMASPTMKPVSGDVPGLHDTVEAYYAATDVQGMRAAVEKARVLGPDSALYHDIAANLAKHEARSDIEFKHLEAALLNPLDESPLQHLWAMLYIRDTKEQWLRSIEICEILAKEHPNNDVRRHAAFVAMYSYRKQNRLDDLEEMRSIIGYQPPLSVIGPFDNDQGKGFDITYPPELLIDTTASYQGMIVPVSWREHPPVRHYGDLDLGAMMHPYKWALAYAATSFSAKREGAYELRLSQSGPVKVWVNDILVYSERYVERFLFEGVVIPVTLRKGVNRLVVKTCNRKRGWKLGVSISMPGGDAPEEDMFSAVPLNTPYAFNGPLPVKEPFQTMESITNRINTPKGSLRSLLDIYSHMDEYGMDVPLVEMTERITQKYPGAIVPQYLLASALWDNGERGRTSDKLNSLNKKYGAQLSLFPLKMARFLKQGKLKRKAREILTTLCAEHPEAPMPCLRLSELYDKANWKEDRLRLLLDMQKRFPGNMDMMANLAESYGDLGFTQEEEEMRLAILRLRPNEEDQLAALYKKRLKAGDLGAAEDYARKLIRSRPYYMSSWRRLGEALRRKRETAAARDAYQKMIDIGPTSPYGYRLLGEHYYQEGKKAEAINQWRRALECDPDNEKLAERLNFIDPPTWGPWTGDVPDEKRLRDVVKSRKDITYSDSANVAYLLDHVVYELKADGSATSVTTFIAHALNDKGRDRLTKYNMPPGGRIRVLHAYSVDPKGRQHEASSIRGRTIRFRKLKTGSTTVIQYQHEENPKKYLAGYFSQRWSFQSFYVQYVDSEFILWSPADVKISEFVRGDKVTRTEDAHNSMKRYAWRAQDVPVPPMEPGSPSPAEICWSLHVSSVPDWSMFQKWEKALLEDAFRTSPELESLTAEILAGAKTPMEKLYAIQEYLEHDIRYQTDYEHDIAGVKPHAAPMVLARRYGDCKDKAVLFITMAKIAGIKARFALVRTSGRGPVLREIPMQQFNHAIVYVPAQEGIAKGRFFDPTVSDLDVKVLRGDDQGAWAYVLSDDHENYEWIQVPYHQPEVNNVIQTVSMSLNSDGSASADMQVESQGMVAMLVRSVAHNSKQFEKMVQALGNRFLPGARVTDYTAGDPKNLRKPFAFGLKATVPAIALREGRQLRMTVPIDWNPGNLLKTSERTYDYVFELRESQRWAYTITPPKGGKVERLPKDYQTDNKYLWFARRSTRKGNSVLVEIEVAILQPRIPVKEFPKLRPEIENILRMMREEVVFKVAK